MSAAAEGRFSPRSRVRKRSEFLFIQATASRVVTPHLVLLVSVRASARSERLRGPASDCTRLGITVPKKMGSSPERSRAKRLIREAFRQLRSSLAADVDLVVIVRKPLGETKLGGIVEEWERAERQIQKRIVEARVVAPIG